MIKIISLFLFIFSIIFLLRYIVEFFISLRSETPKPMGINKITEICLYISISYILTFIILA
jgi:hypothetical protein